MGLGLLLSDWPEYHAVLPDQAVFGCGVDYKFLEALFCFGFSRTNQIRSFQMYPRAD